MPPQPKRRLLTPAGINPANSTPKPAPMQLGEQGFFGYPPLFMLLYGPPGVGKTSFLSHFPDVQYVIDPQDRGAVTLQKFKQMQPTRLEPIVAPNFTEMISELKSIAAGRVQCSTAVVEGLLGIERFCFIDHCNAEFHGNFGKDGFYSYGNGPKSAAKHLWPDFIEALQDVNAAGINVILTGHSSIKPFKNPMGRDYDKYVVNVDVEVWNMTFRAFDSVLFYHSVVDTVVPDGSMKTKADSNSARRLIGCQPDAVYDAKNQYGLPAIIEGGDSHETAFNNFVAALKRGS